MKNIILLAFTFLGICKGFAQTPAASNTENSLKTSGTIAPKMMVDSLKEKATVKLFPNPVKNKAELEVKGFEAGTVQLQIITVSGKVIRNDSRLLFSGNENIVVMFALQPGIYFIVLKQNNTVVKKKMLVQ